jgi:hypothetical protein
VDAAEAKAGFEALLADYLRVLGPDDPETLAIRGNLAYWRGMRRGRRPRSRPCWPTGCECRVPTIPGC